MNSKPSNKIVLVMVDDDEDDRLLVEAALYEACFKCDFHYVADGIEMIDYLHQRGRYETPGSAPRPDIVLLDLNMPKMSGRELLGTLKKDPDFRSMPVVILTTSREEEDISCCYELGANTYIIKEPSLTGLVAALKVFKEYWLGTALLPPREN